MTEPRATFPSFTIEAGNLHRLQLEILRLIEVDGWPIGAQPLAINHVDTILEADREVVEIGLDLNTRVAYLTVEQDCPLRVAVLSEVQFGD